MSHISAAWRGMRAVEEKKYEEAIKDLSTALKESASPLWLLARSRAFIGVGRFQEALDDADLAWHKAYQRNQRPGMTEAHYRRAVAHYRLGHLADADCCCLYSMRIVKGHPALEKQDPAEQFVDEQGRWTVTMEAVMEEAKAESVNKAQAYGMALGGGDQNTPQVQEWRKASTLRLQILNSMKKLAEDDPNRKPTVRQKPAEKALSNPVVENKQEKKEAKPAGASAAPADAPLRLQEFQSTSNMSVSIFSKGNNKEKLQVEFLPFAVRMQNIVYPAGHEADFELDLWGEIEPAASTYTVTPNKVELNLKKKSPGKWAALLGEGKAATKSATEKEEEEKVEALKQARKKAMEEAEAAKPKPAETKPSYPTSSKSGPKDWDKIGEEEDDDKGSDVNLFFKNLYSNSTPEQQRAMMKSFTESNGTSLSTNWEDVKDRVVETVPPEGVEAKKW
ncbi:SGS domain-containing protein [Stachybotrys elegans]|uniref:SGS domain-containing protein n=1 Tax=Stachybotrys elegans TaxID=80388 RepID=A0A8K0SR73_9HYPO|nr:SGS domain-containing protein [Stachybotrys elegans]